MQYIEKYSRQCTARENGTTTTLKKQKDKHHTLTVHEESVGFDVRSLVCCWVPAVIGDYEVYKQNM
jgi:hypothetical protein